MGEEKEEMQMRRDYGSSSSSSSSSNEEKEEERMLEWEDGLPSAADDLTPLSQHLIPPQLASAFSIKPEPLSTMLDVNHATHKTLSTLLLLHPPRTYHHHHQASTTKTNNLFIKTFSSSSTFNEDEDQDHPMVVEEEHDDDNQEEEEEEEDPPGTPPTIDGSETRRIRRRRRILLEVEENNNTTTSTNTEEEEADSGFRTENSNDDIHSAARTLKRPRLVWTPQLHKRFVDVVAHLGIKNAVPKTIMQLMNVEGLTRENVASHLQKYRLYLKRMQQGLLSNEGPSSSDPLFSSTPVPPHTLLQHDEPPGGSTGSSGKQHISPPPPPPPPMQPYYGGNMLPMPVLGHGFGGNPAAAAYQGFEFHPYGMFRDQQIRRDWSGNRFGPMVSYPKASKR